MHCSRTSSFLGPNISSQDSSVGIPTDYGLRDRGSNPGGGLGIFLFNTVSRPALRPTQPPIQWVQGVLSLGIKRPWREADNSPPPSAEVEKCVDLYLHSPNMFSWCSVSLSTGTNLPLPSCPNIFLTILFFSTYL
jgi:hypothetical protein